MMDTGIQIGQVIRFKEPVMPNDGPWFIAKGSLGTVIAKDGPLVVVRTHKHQVAVAVRHSVLESAPLSLRKVA